MGKLEDAIKRLRGAEGGAFCAVTTDGEQSWDIASNGYVAIGTKTDAPPDGKSEKLDAFWPRVIAEPSVHSGETTAAEILAWVGDYTIHPFFVPCMDCDGTGKHECECGHTHPCGYCDEKGEVPGSLPLAEGRWIGDLFWDRHLIGHAVHGAEGVVEWKVLSSTKRLLGTTNYLVLRCRDRVSVVAGMSYGTTNPKPFIGAEERP